MGWVKIDDDFPYHPKVSRVGAEGIALFIESLCHSAKFLTDGRLTRLEVSGMRLVKKPLKVAPKLVEAGLWEADGQDFVIHDYLEYQPSARDVRANREWARSKQSMYRNTDVLDRVRARDGSNCRYCGEVVNWKDRRGPKGGQFDHVIPRGEHSLDNLVVSCRSCNYRKGSRTPEEAGMQLTPVTHQIDSGLYLDTHQNGTSFSRVREGDGTGSGVGSVIRGELERGYGPPLLASMSSHRVHAFCGKVCVPEFIHDEFLRKLPDSALADQQLRDWYLWVNEEWRGRAIGDRPEKFWRLRFEEWQGTTQKTVSRGPSKDWVPPEVREAKA